MDNNSQWIEMNLQRQRKMLEDKQKQKRHQSAGSVRTTTAASSVKSLGNSYTEYPPTAFDTSLPTAFDSMMMTSSVSNASVPALHPPPPVAAPRSHPVPRHSAPMMPVVKNESLISISDSSDQEISAKLSRANLSKTVVSDDDDDDDDKKSSIDPWNPRTGEPQQLNTDRQPDYAFIKNNLVRFIEDPVQENCLYKCTITRQKSGMDKGMFPTYYLHLEEGEREQKVKVFLLAARKRKKSTTANYLISHDPTNLSKEGNGYCAKVRSNALGTHFTIYDRGFNRKKTDNSLSIRQELAAVIYDTNVLGFKGPRKMTVIIPALEVDNPKEHPKRTPIRPLHDSQTLLERFKTERPPDQIKVLHNKSPQWNDETQSYVLNFHGRVTQASVKNFQIIHTQSPEYVIMQFGRVSDDEFTMDFRYPLSVVQAFGIAMTSFHGKLACE